MSPNVGLFEGVIINKHSDKTYEFEFLFNNIVSNLCDVEITGFEQELDDVIVNIVKSYIRKTILSKKRELKR